MKIEADFVCRACGGKFKSYQELNTHIDQAHTYKAKL